MTKDAQPVVVAFDGSPEARAAVGSAAALFPDRKLLIATVWEPGLAMMVGAMPDTTGAGMPYPLPPGSDRTVDRAEHDHAESAAAAGARLARELGATAEPLPLPDTVNVAETLAEVAESRDAAALVVGSAAWAA